MFDLKRLVTKAGGSSDKRAGLDSDFHSAAAESDNLEQEYEALIASQFRRFGIDRACVSLEVKRGSEAGDGRGVFVGMIQLVKWERVSALRILLGLPMLETKVRQAAHGTWLGDVSHFGGLWLNASESVDGGQGSAELRDLIVRLAPPRKAAASNESAQSGREPAAGGARGE